MRLKEPRKHNTADDAKSSVRKGISRRGFLKLAILASAIAVVGEPLTTYASEQLLPWLHISRERAPVKKVGPEYYEGSSTHEWAMVIDLTKCIACGACIDACSRENSRFLGVEVPLGARTRIVFREINGKRVPMHLICQHCSPAPCVEVCPTGASIKRKDGIVLIDYDLCIGCKYCMSACPYGARYVNGGLSAVDKCTFCAHRVDKGLKPACVEACPVGARIFGDLKDPNSEVSKLVKSGKAVKIKALPDIEPHVYYILP
ncbi:MAG: 4Fe-4S dicluster domain-containing protein [Pyrodictiaceae archaeon]